MFGNQNSNSAPAQPSTPTLSFQGIPLDRRPQKLPLGRGVYEIVKAGTRKTQTMMDQFYAVLRCVSHESEASHVGGTFEWQTQLQGLYVKENLGDIKKLLIYSFGEAAAKLDEKVVGAVLDAQCLSDNWARFNAEQTIEGKTIVGNKLKIAGMPGKIVKKDGTPKLDKRTGQPLKQEDAFPRYYMDPLPAA